MDVEIATTNSGLTREDLKDFQTLAGEIPIHSFPQWGSHGTNFSWPLSEWLRKNIKNYDAVHLHALFSPVCTLAAFWARQKNLPYVVRPLGTLSPYTFSSGNRFLKRFYFGMVEQHTVKAAAAFHFTTPLEMQKAMGLCQIPRPAVIPNPVEAAREGIKDPTHPPKNILFMSRIHPKKGLDLLIRAFGQLAPHYPETQLVIAGVGEKDYLGRVRRLVHSEGLGDRVRFLGFIGEIQKSEVFKESLVLALPSRDENFGISVAEAMGAGLPVVVSDQVGIWPEIQEYGAGSVVPCRVDSIRNALEKLIRNPELYARMGRCGVRLVRERYNLNKIRAGLLRLYSEIVNA